MTNPVSLLPIGSPPAAPPMRLAQLVLAASLTLIPTLAFAQGTREQQQACTPDALRLCMSSIPDVAKTTACMKAHVAELSPRCQAAFNEATPKAADPKTADPKPAAKVVESKPAEPKAARAFVRSREAAREEHRSPRTVVAARQDERRQERQDERHEVERRVSNRAPRLLARSPREDEPDLAPQRRVERSVVVVPEPAVATPDLDSARVTLAAMCRRGLIDAYTCTNTVPSLGLGE